jgi:hypothetical protein
MKSMTVQFSYLNEHGEEMQNQEIVNHAVLFPISKGMYYLVVDFKYRAEIDHFGSDNGHSEDLYFTSELSEDIYVKVNVNADRPIFVFGQITKKTYRGIVCFSGIIAKAVERKYGRRK